MIANLPSQCRRGTIRDGRALLGTRLRLECSQGRTRPHKAYQGDLRHEIFSEQFDWPMERGDAARGWEGNAFPTGGTWCGVAFACPQVRTSPHKAAQGGTSQYKRKNFADAQSDRGSESRIAVWLPESGRAHWPQCAAVRWGHRALPIPCLGRCSRPETRSMPANRKNSLTLSESCR
jgi:hypothetical protein